MRFLPRLRSTRVGGPSTRTNDQQLSRLVPENFETQEHYTPTHGDARDAVIGATKPLDRHNLYKINTMRVPIG